MKNPYMSRVPFIPALLAALMLCTSSASAANQYSGEEIRLSGSFEDQQFLAGRTIEVTAQVDDDIFAAGRNITFDGAKADYVIAAGSKIRLRDVEISDLIAAGLDIEISGIITDDMVAAVAPVFGSGDVILRPGAVVGDDAMIAGDHILIEGAIEGDAKIAARRVTIEGGIGGDAEIEADSIRLGPRAIIGGDLKYRGDDPPEMAEGAVVMGEIVELPERAGLSELDIDIEVPKPDKGLLIGLGIAGLLAGLVLRAVFGFIINLVFPGLLRDAVAQINGAPLVSFGIGVALIIAVPIASLIVMVTIVGIPLALMALALYAVAYGFAIATAGAWVGDRLRRAFKRRIDVAVTWKQSLWTALGMAAVGLIGAVPFIGWLAAMILTAISYGAFAGMSWNKIRG